MRWLQSPQDQATLDAISARMSRPGPATDLQDDDRGLGWFIATPVACIVGAALIVAIRVGWI